MKKLNILKKGLFFTLPIASIGIATPLIVTSCGSTSNSSEPGWKTDNLPSGMTVENHNIAVIKLSESPFWTTGLTSGSTTQQILASISNLNSGLGKLAALYLYYPTSTTWTLDSTKGTGGISMDTTITNGVSNLTWHFITLDGKSQTDVKLTLTNLTSNS